MAIKAVKDEYYVRPPRGQKGAFKIIRRRRSVGDPSKNETLVSEVLDAVNRKFRDGTYARDEAREAVDRELARLRRLAGGGKSVALMPANLRTLKKYWESEYAHRDLIDSPSSYSRLRRAVESLGDTPLTAARPELQRAVNSRLAGERQRDAVRAINQLLKWLGRTDATLTPFKKSRRRVKYLSETDVKAMAAQIPDAKLRALTLVAFATGCRTGELFYLQTRHLKAGLLQVEAQVDNKKVTRDTKTRQIRDVVVVPGGAAALAVWLSVPEKERFAIRGRRLSELIRKACKKAFPDDASKHLTFHDLRHSYAIHLLNKGVSLSLVAQSLGDSEAVANEYYSGFVLTKPGIETIRGLLCK